MIYAAVGISMLLSLLTVFGDAFIKFASLQKGWQGIWWVILGAVIYAMTAFGWFYVMKNLKLFTVGVVYSVSTIALLSVVSIFIFHEKANAWEFVGLAMAICSIILMSRFA